MKKLKYNSKLFFILGLVIITFIAFYPSLFNEFVNWDDPKHILENSFIRGLSFGYISKMFTSYSMGSYHPLVEITYAVNYAIHQLNPFGYHLFNLLNHIGNSVLVFWLIYLLTHKNRIAIFVAILFAVHPLHVQSVAWVTERRDLMYTLFYLIGLIFYTKYTSQSQSKKYFLLTFGSFVLALFSKSAAVTFPLTLLALDYYLDRKSLSDAIRDKIPFFVVSFVFGLITLYGAIHSQAIEGNTTYLFYDRVFLASYSLIMYIAKLIVPYPISVIYPFPSKQGIFLPVEFYVCAILLIILVTALLRSTRIRKEYMFGFLFYLSNIILTIQLFIMGQNFMADHYTYLSSVGVFFVFGVLIERFINRLKEQKRKVIYILLSIYFLTLSVVTFDRCKDWRTSLVLWTAAIELYGDLTPIYGKRAYAHHIKKDYDAALADLTKAIEIKPDDINALNFRGVIYGKIRKYDLAFADFKKAIEVNPNVAEIYNNRGTIYELLNQFDQAFADYNKALSLKPKFPDALSNRGIILEKRGEIQKAMIDYNKSILINPHNSSVYNNRGMLYLRIGNYNDALKDFDKAIDIDVHLAQAYNNRGIVYAHRGQFKKAIKDFEKAVVLDPFYDTAFNNKLMAIEAQKNQK